jgi:hypothetical protein
MNAAWVLLLARHGGFKATCPAERILAATNLFSPDTLMHFRRLRMEPLEDRRMLATFTVTNLLDGAVTAAGQLPGSLRQAIFDANALAGADEIVFEDTTGTINLTAGEYVVSQGLTITGPGRDLLTLDAQQQSRIFAITTSQTVELSGMTITNGKPLTGQGGGISSAFYNGMLKLSQVTVTGNETVAGTGHGGGIYTEGSIEIVDSTISNNRTVEWSPSNMGSGGSSGSGGGIYSARSVSITNSIVTQNTASLEGGGIYSDGLSMTNCLIVDNTTRADGGGVYQVEFGLGNAAIIGSTFSGNRASNAAGGGAYLSRAFTNGIKNTVFENNFALLAGGGLFLRAGGGRIWDSSFIGNEAGLGGGIYSNTGPLYVYDSLVTGNTAISDGGGISMASLSLVSGSTITNNTAGRAGGGIWGGRDIYHSTITGNTAPEGKGSGIAFFTNSQPGSFRISNSIVAGNTNSDIDKLSGPNTAVSLGFNLIGTGTALPTFNQPGDRTGVLDPRLAPLADNGGPTMTHALLPDSPAFNAGDPNAVIGVDGVLEFDQRGDGYSRIRYGRMDIGAYESQVIHADFDSDGDVDGRDFLAWQRGYGTPVPDAIKSDGDADDDTDVDGHDLAIWQNQYSAAEELVATMRADSSPSPTSSAILGLTFNPITARKSETSTLIVDDEPAFSETIIDAAFDDLSPTVGKVADFGDFVSSRHKAATAGGAFGDAFGGEESL